MRGNAGDRSLTRVEIMRYTMLIVSLFWYFEDQFHQHQDGLVADDRFAGSLATLAIDLRWPGFRACWRQNRYLYGAQFRAFMDDILERGAVGSRARSPRSLEPEPGGGNRGQPLRTA